MCSDDCASDDFAAPHPPSNRTPHTPFCIASLHFLFFSCSPPDSPSHSPPKSVRVDHPPNNHQRFVPHDPSITGWRVRVAPNASATTIGLLAVGDRFKVLQEHNAWVKIFDVESCPLLSGWTLKHANNREVVQRERDMLMLEQEHEDALDLVATGLSLVTAETKPLVTFCKLMWRKAKQGATIAKCSLVAALKKRYGKRDPFGLSETEDDGSIETLSVVLPKARKQSMLSLGLHFAKIPDIPYTMMALECTIGGTAAGRCRDLVPGQILVTIGQIMVLGLEHSEIVRIIENVQDPYIVLGMADAENVVPHLPRLFELEDAVQQTQHMQQQQHKTEQFEIVQQQQHHQQMIQQSQQQMHHEQQYSQTPPPGMTRLELQRWQLKCCNQHSGQVDPATTLQLSPEWDNSSEERTPPRGTDAWMDDPGDDDVVVTPKNVDRFASIYSASPERGSIPQLPPHLDASSYDWLEDVETTPYRPHLIDPPSSPSTVLIQQTPESFLQPHHAAYSDTIVAAASISEAAFDLVTTTPDRPTQSKSALPTIRYQPTIGHIGRKLFDDVSFENPTQKEVRSGYALFRRTKKEIEVPGSAQSGSTKL